ncbi:MAG: swr1 complex component [Candelina mexicana]|nr:MAG: swr1 complex component [Candelina mexicana]
MRNRSRSGISNNDDDHNHTTQGKSCFDTPNTSILSSRIIENGHVISSPKPGDEREISNDEPLNKKRKLADPTVSPRSASRPISPPWKTITVEGPTSFVEGGRRKSSRTNAVPLELQPQSDKRQTRAAIQRTQVKKSRFGAESIKSVSQSALTPSHSQTNGRRPHFAGKIIVQDVGKSPAKTNGLKDPPSKCGLTKSSHEAFLNNHFVKPPTPAKITKHPMQTRSPQGTRKSARVPVPSNSNGRSEADIADWDEDDEPIEVDRSFRPQKLRFRVRMPTVTIQHPGHVLPPRKFSSFEEWLKSDDCLSVEDGSRLTEADARTEAYTREKILEASRPGGVLSEERCSSYVPDPQEEPDRQYAHYDHLVAQALHFRKLLKQEQRQHLQAAKRIAYAAAAEWRRRQPKTDEDIIQEQRDASLAKYKQIRRDIQQKWDLVNQEVRKRRLIRWEEEQQVLGKQALNEMLEQSTQLLDQRRLRDSSEYDTDEANGREHGSVEINADSQSENNDESNMSTSDEESDEGPLTNGVEDDDEGLTVDELRQKYASLPDESYNGPSGEPEDTNLSHNLYRSEGEAAQELQGNAEINIAEISIDEVDEALIDDSYASTDMDDDMGDSEITRDSEEDEDDESESGDNEQDGLLGFFSKRDIVASNRESTEDPSSPKPAMKDEGEIYDDADYHYQQLPGNSQVRPPSTNNSEGTTNDIRKDLTTRINGFEHTPDVEELSGGPSSQASPETNRTSKPSEDDSVSTIDPHIESRHELLAATPEPSKMLKTSVPFLLRGTLREYQHYGLDWLAGLYANHTNGILADEMGLGKTIQTIALLAHLAVEHEVWGPHLIVVPTSVMLNWEMEFKKWCPGFKILTYYGTQEERKQKRKGWLDDDAWHVCITSYQLVLQDSFTFKRRDWHYMVLDEAHNIKNFRSLRWQTLLGFKTRARLLLTGTPLQNNLTELWSLLFFLMPSDSVANGIGGFADLKEFSDWFRRPVEQILEHGRETMDDEAKQIVGKLHKVLRPFLLRRLKADVEKQMPGKYEHVVHCRLSKRQRYLYDGFMSLSKTRETLASGNYLSIINCLMQLRKVCNHPDLFETRQIVTSFAMPKSAVADFEIKELLVRRRLLQEHPMKAVNLDFLNLAPISSEPALAFAATESTRHRANMRPLHDLCFRQGGRIDWEMRFDASSVNSTLAFMQNTAKMSRLEELRHCIYLNALRGQKRPMYSSGLLDMLVLSCRKLPIVQQPEKRALISEWFLRSSTILGAMVPTLHQRSRSLESTVQKFACITPAVVATDLTPIALTPRGVEVVKEAQQVCHADAFHEARIRLSIAFPDKRLLQYDCGKLQRLDKLLRDLQAGGHRALIFTQMTKVLDILEQFLNIHGHRYLRLDGATKIEQRQILTDQFNNDDRILAFILSSRSGGLGINLTGADTVIFYDLDWNPAMDKQCQDRCHRIGQTRDVHIYRFVSEYTIESNILRKANQKRMLDDVVIQEGEFTTDYFNKLSVRDMLGDEASVLDGDAEANAAMDRVLGGGGSSNVGKVLEQVEDREDCVAANIAEREMVHTDDADFEERSGAGSGTGMTPKTPAPSTPAELMPPPSAFPTTPTTTNKVNGEVFETSTTLEATESGLITPGSADAEIGDAGDEPGHVDDYMLRFMEWDLTDVPVVPPIDKNRKKAKKGQAHRIKVQR